MRLPVPNRWEYLTALATDTARCAEKRWIGPSIRQYFYSQYRIIILLRTLIQKRYVTDEVGVT